MEKEESTFESLISNAEEYGKTSVELIRLKSIDKAAHLLSSFLFAVVMIMIVTLLVLIINIGLAIWIGDVLGKMYYGFFVIAGFYALLAFILQVSGEKIIKNPIRNSFINLVLHK